MNRNVKSICPNELEGKEINCSPVIKKPRSLFPMTPLQEAYFVGQQGIFNYSTPAFIYHEYKVAALDLEKLKRAVETIINRHDSLRCVPCDNGYQTIESFNMRKAFCYSDLSGMSEEEQNEILIRKREDILNSDSIVDAYHHLYVDVAKVGDDYSVSILLGLYSLDGMSVAIILKELVSEYNDDIQPYEAPSYKEYVESIVDFKNTDDYERQFNFWKKEINNIPLSPRLPRKTEKDNHKSRFIRLTSGIYGPQYEKLLKNCSVHGVSINAVIFTLYCNVINKWASSDEFTVTVMNGFRPSWIKDVYSLVGNCSSTILTKYCGEHEQFVERASEQFAYSLHSLRYNCVAGVEVLREYSILNSLTGKEPVMPVVFTSGIGLDPDKSGFVIRNEGWENTFSCLHTPQVTLDHQVNEVGDGIRFNWDYVESAFPEGMIKEMFDCYCRSLAKLADDEFSWTSKSFLNESDENAEKLRKSNTTTKNFEKKCLHEGFLISVADKPDNMAILSDEKCLTYKELYGHVLSMVFALKDSGFEEGDIVAVHCEKGWKQIVSVLAVMLLKGVYLPLDVKDPGSRKLKILNQAGCRYVITNDDICLEDVKSVAFVDAMYSGDMEPEFSTDNADSPAYIIFTSGSTGRPKGVSISHKSAMNTILDIIDRFNVGSSDRVIALSALNFDLSVFDIFGILSVGGAMVFPVRAERPDPGKWIEAVNTYHVTIWNSVPAFMEMLSEFGYQGEEAIKKLKTIMLSGDWFKGELANRIIDLNKDIQLISMGGATEASIWSNYFIVDKKIKTAYVPYGRPLTNQALYVLDKNMNEVPVWVEGDLYIGGEGVGNGYINDHEKTKAQFVVHAKTGEKLYKTGDLASYAGDGVVYFHGRKDFQVKVRGHRIELGEIEMAASRYDKVEHAVAFVLDEHTNRAKIALACVGRGDFDKEKLVSMLNSALPTHMVPAEIFTIDELPLSANGKVDRKRLVLSLDVAGSNTKIKEIPPATKTEASLASIWERLLERKVESVEEDFFLSGGTSIMAVRLISEIDKRHNVRAPMDVLFNSGSVRALADYVDKNRNPEKIPHYMSIRDGDVCDLVLLPPVGGNIICYKDIIRNIDQDVAIHGVYLGSEHLRTLQSDSLSLAGMVDLYSRELVEKIKTPYVFLFGWSMGGVLAYELAKNLQYRGVDIQHVYMIDSWTGDLSLKKLSEGELVKGYVRDIAGSGDVEEFSMLDKEKSPLKQGYKYVSDVIDYDNYVSQFAVYSANYTMLSEYVPPYVDVNVSYWHAGLTDSKHFPALHRFTTSLDKVGKEVEVFYENEDHFTILNRVREFFPKLLSDLFSNSKK